MAFLSTGSTFRCILPKPTTALVSSNPYYDATQPLPVAPYTVTALLETELPILCSTCDQILDGPCVRHFAKHIMDMPPHPLALSSIPDELTFRSIELPGKASTKAVFAKVVIPQSTIFGPLVSPLGKENQFTAAAFAVQTQSGWMDCSLESNHTCNWMKFIRLASSKKEQNLLAYQQDGGIYFSTLSDIQPNDELKVWYCYNYAALLGKPSLSHEEPKPIDGKVAKKVIGRHVRQLGHAKKQVESVHSEIQAFQQRISLEKETENADVSVPRDEPAILESSFNSKRKRDPSEDRDEILDSDDDPEFEIDAEDSDIQSEDSEESEKLTRKPAKRARTSSQMSPEVPGKKRPPYSHQCEQCYGRFHREDNLEIHMYAHQKEIPDEFPDHISERCTGCRSKFIALTFPELVSHMDKHIRKGQVFKVCPQCGEKCSNGRKLERHIQTVHTENAKKRGKRAKKPQREGKPQYERKCCECSTTYPNLDSFKIHCVVHGMTMPKDYLISPICPACKEEFPSPKALRDHIESHARKQPVYNCQFCEDKFKHKYQRENHYRAQHEDLLGQLTYMKPEKGKSIVTEGGFPCPTCGVRFTNLKASSAHQKMHVFFPGHYPCQICLKTFDSSRSYKDHIPEHCVDGAYPCRVCDKVHSEFKKLRLHMEKAHTGKLLKCEICGYSNRVPTRFNRHMLIHTDKFDFKCEECPREFKQVKMLRNHIKKFHNPDNPKMPRSTNSRRGTGRNSTSDYMNYVYKCRDCKLGFLTQRQLVRHLSDVHPDKSHYSIPELNLPVVKAVKYECSVCKKMFVTEDRRSAHIESVHPEVVTVIPSGKKNRSPKVVIPPQRDVVYMAHWCPVCDIQFNSAARLLQHVDAKHPDTGLGDVGNIAMNLD